MSEAAAEPLALRISTEQWPLRVPFRITGQTTVNLDVVIVTVERNGLQGRGEAAGVDYRRREHRGHGRAARGGARGDRARSVTRSGATVAARWWGAQCARLRTVGN